MIRLILLILVDTLLNYIPGAGGGVEPPGSSVDPVPPVGGSGAEGSGVGGVGSVGGIYGGAVGVDGSLGIWGVCGVGIPPGIGPPAGGVGWF